MPSRTEMGLAEAAARLRIPYQDAHRLLLTGRIIGRKRGGRWFVSVAAVDNLAREAEHEAAAGASVRATR